MEYTMLGMIVCGLWTVAKLTKKAEGKIFSKSDGMVLDLFKRSYTIGYSEQRYHQSRQIHQGTLASCYQVWKQGFWR